MGELKAAASDYYGFGLSDQDLVVMATSGAAAVARWDGPNGVGQIVAGKKADLFVFDGARGSAGSVYAKLINAKETDVRLVVIDGVQRYGIPTLMKKVDGPTDLVVVGGEKRVLRRCLAWRRQAEVCGFFSMRWWIPPDRRRDHPSQRRWRQPPRRSGRRLFLRL